MGRWVKDSLCISNSATQDCVSNFTFLSVESTSNLALDTQFSSVCGLKPYQERGNTSSELIPYLFANGAIESAVFTMYLRNASNISYIEFGNPPNINNYFFAEMVPNPQDWAVNLLEINVLGSLRVQGLVFDSG